MKDYDFEGEARLAWAPDLSESELVCITRRAYAAGVQASGGGSDLDRLVILASTHRWWGAPGVPSPSWQDEVAAECASMLSALKAQVVEK